MVHCLHVDQESPLLAYCCLENNAQLVFSWRQRPKIGPSQGLLRGIAEGPNWIPDLGKSVCILFPNLTSGYVNIAIENGIFFGELSLEKW